MKAGLSRPSVARIPLSGKGMSLRLLINTDWSVNQAGKKPDDVGGERGEKLGGMGNTGSSDRTVKCGTFISPQLFGALLFCFLDQLG